MQHEALQPLHQLLQPYGVSFVGQRVLLQGKSREEDSLLIRVGS